MTTTSQLGFSRRAVVNSTTRVIPDRRRHRRVEFALLGRFMRANKLEFPCKLNDISVGGASMMSPVEVEMGERIVAYFDHVGGIEGSVVRVFEGGFAISIQASQHKREKLAAQLTWLINQHELGLPDERRHDRVPLVGKSSTLKLDDGQAIECAVLDISLSGASVGTDVRPAIGTAVTLGKLRARIVRHHEAGLGVEFVDIQEPEALRRHFG